MADKHDRSVHVGGSVSGSIIQTGDKNKAQIRDSAAIAAPSANPAQDIAELHAMLCGLAGVDAEKIGKALDMAEEAAAEAEPDKGVVGSMLERALKLAKGAADFSAHIDKIAPKVKALAAWIGASSVATSLLGLL